LSWVSRMAEDRGMQEHGCLAIVLLPPSLPSASDPDRASPISPIRVASRRPVQVLRGGPTCRCVLGVSDSVLVQPDCFPHCCSLCRSCSCRRLPGERTISKTSDLCRSK